MPQDDAVTGVSHKSVRTPKYRLHRPSGLAVVTLGGKDVYLGKHGTAASKRAWKRRVGEWLAAGGNPAPVPPADCLTVETLINAYRKHVDEYYRGSRTVETMIKPVMTRWKRLYGETSVAEFSPLCLKAFRASLLAEGTEPGAPAGRRLSRPYVNRCVRWVRACVRWGVGEGLVPPSVLHGLDAVEPLRYGRTDAPEPEPVTPVADAVVDATLIELDPPIADMVRVQRLTGMRPGEVCNLTTGEIDAGGTVWLYRPRLHKTAHLGKARVIPIGPRAQEILRRYLRTELAAPLFSPKAADIERRETRRKNNKTPMTPSRAKRDAQRARRLQRRRFNDQYDPVSYAAAIGRACDRAFLHPTLSKIEAADLTDEQRAELLSWRREHRWAPNQLRHTKATELRKAFGLDTAGAILGHSKLETTQIYAERASELAIHAAQATG